MFTWAALKLLPWHLIGAVVCLLVFVGAITYGVEIYGHSRYEEGKAEVEVEVERLTAQANSDARKSEEAHQEKVNALDVKYQSDIVATRAQLADVQSQLADAHAVGERLRATVRAITQLHATKGSEPAGSADAATQTLGQLLESCSGIAEQNSAVAVELAGEAERLADELRGLQSYATQVSKP